MLDFLKGVVLVGLDKLAVAAYPFRPFTRPPKIVDKASPKAKADWYYEDIKSRFLYGKNCEFFWNMKPSDGGDHAIWQGIWAATCAMRGSRYDTNRALAGMELLQNLGGDNRLARAADLIGGPMRHDPSKVYYEADGYRYRQNCSESSLIGHLYGLWAIMAYDQEPDHIKRARLLAINLADQLIADGYRMLDHDGTPAKFGDLRPAWDTAPIRIAALCATLLLAYKACGRMDYRERYLAIARKYKGALSHLETRFVFIDPGYDDLLVYLVLMILTTECEAPELSRVYRAALDNQWAKNKNEGNAFYIFAHWFMTRSTGAQYLSNGVTMLAEFNTRPGMGYPTGKEGVERINSTDSSVDKCFWGVGKWRKQVAKQPLPVWARPATDFVWQRSPYALDGWTGQKSPDEFFNGLDYCAAYYLADKGGLWS